MELTITEIKKPVRPGNSRRAYPHVMTAEAGHILLPCGYPFPIGTRISGSLKVPDAPVPEQIGTDEAARAWADYYRTRILCGMSVLSFPQEEEWNRFRLYQKLTAFLTPSSALFFLSAFSADLLEEKLEGNPFWFHSRLHGLPEENFPIINRTTIVDTFDLRLEQIRAGIRYFLSLNETSYGHTWMSPEGLLSVLNRRMEQDGHDGLSLPLLNAVLSRYEEFYFDCMHAAYQSTWEAENQVMENVRLMLAMAPLFPEAVELSDGLCEEQRNAITGIVHAGNLSILTGGPGTGKTTCLADIIRQYQNQPGAAHISVLAPTGRAVGRARESLHTCLSAEEFDSIEIKTVHKFLGHGLPKFKQLSVLEETRQQTLCIVDESSMVDIFLFKELLQALDLCRCKLVLIGDKNQLPSVSAGNVLTDLIALGVPAFALTINHRSAQSITYNAGLILAKKQIPFRQDEFCSLLPPEFLSDILHTVDFTSPSVLFLTPYRKPIDRNGRMIPGNTTDINRMIHHMAFPCQPGNEDSFVPGDKVICIRNNYKQGYFNGDIGYVVRITEDAVYVRIDAERTVEVFDSNELEYAYAITIHKAQGTECDTVYLYLPDDMPEQMLTFEILYTAMTRAKRKLCVLANQETLYRAMLHSAGNRHTFLQLSKKF